MWITRWEVKTKFHIGWWVFGVVVIDGSISVCFGPFGLQFAKTQTRI